MIQVSRLILNFSIGLNYFMMTYIYIYMASPQTGHSYFRHTFAAISMTTMKYAKSSSNLARKKALCVYV